MTDLNDNRRPPASVAFGGGDDLSGMTVGGFDYPVVEAGKYQFVVQQTLNVDGNQQWSAAHEVTVEAPRYRLADDAVTFRSPADSAVGDFQTTLASVTLNDPKLPWLRTATPEGYPDTARAAWLQLVLFDPEELPAPSPGKGGILSVDLVTHAASLAIGTFDGLDGRPASSIGLANTGKLVTPGFTDTSGLIHDGDTSCSMIAVPAKQVLKSFPKWQEMPFLTQTRVDDTGGREATVLCNRFSPKIDGDQPFKRMVHLVSVEDYWQLLDGTADGEAQLRQHAAADDVICFLAMTSWSFQNGGPEVKSDQFTPLALNLAENPETEAPRSISFVHPVAQGDASNIPQAVRNRFNSGYMPFPFKLVTQEESFCWYRGPLVPFETTPTNPVPSERVIWSRFSDAMVYDLQDGIFDLSLSGAWQTGRILSLADLNLMTAWAVLLKQLRTKTEKKMMARRGGFSSPTSATRTFVDLVQRTGLNARATDRFTAPVKDLAARRQRLRAYPTPTEMRAAVRAVAVDDPFSGLAQDALDTVIDTLARFIRLEGVPFHMFVPADSYLPMESLRAFNIDPEWLMTMIDGALSLGLRKAIDHELYTALRSEIWQRAIARTTLHRARRRPGNAAPKALNASEFLGSGVLLRSHIVDAWDQLTLAAYKVDGENSTLVPLELWREERLAGSTRLWLFLDRPDVIVLAPPVGRLHLGVSEAGTIVLRNLGDGAPVGQIIAGAPQVEIDDYLREDGLTVKWWTADGNGLVEGLAAALAAQDQSHAHPGTAVPLEPQALIIQLLVGTPALELHRPGLAGVVAETNET